MLSELKSTVIQAPPQFGLTSLAHFLVNEAWKDNNLWVYIDSRKAKQHNIDKLVAREVESLGKQTKDVKAIVVDSWRCSSNSELKKIRNLCKAYPDVPVIVMQTIDDVKFIQDTDDEGIDLGREFQPLHLLALPRNQIRKVVAEYNKAKDVGDEDVVLSKVISDLDMLNIHRTAFNCLTLLKVAEKHFDENLVNRTRMIEMVLTVLFDMDSLPTYKTKPDLKDTEYVLGRFCEWMIRNETYEFTRGKFVQDLKGFCQEKLIDLEVEVVFDVLLINNILIQRGTDFVFRSAFWVYYFGAKRMHHDSSFRDYVFESKRYVGFPEIIEFYTGIDRRRDDALKLLVDDLHQVRKTVQNKVNLPGAITVFDQIQWKPSEEQIENAKAEISESVVNSGLPETIKDQHADATYNQIRPYNQTIQTFFEEYSLYNLFQNLRASSRALRNSDYVDPDLKRLMLDEITKSWEQISEVLLTLTPLLASKGVARFAGHGFILGDGFGETIEEKVKNIILVNPTNVVGLFKEDLFSSKLGPLLFEKFNDESVALKKHHLALLLIFCRPRGWKQEIENHMASLHKNSYYLSDVVLALRARYKYDFADDVELRDLSYLIKLGLAKHTFGGRKPGLDKIRQISDENLPERND